VLDDFMPSAVVGVAWRYKSTDDYNITAGLGNSIAPSKLQHPPNIYVEEASSPKSNDAQPVYVLTLTDPDAPSRDDPKWSEICHWIIATRGGKGKHNKPNEVVEYKAPGPPKKTGKHRYVFTIWLASNR
jgi:phosphatidylethanolamine-binding protein